MVQSKPPFRVWCEDPSHDRPRCVANFVFEVLRDKTVDGKPELVPFNRWVLDETAAWGKSYGPDPAGSRHSYRCGCGRVLNATRIGIHGWTIECADCGERASRAADSQPNYTMPADPRQARGDISKATARGWIIACVCGEKVRANAARTSVQLDKLAARGIDRMSLSDFRAIAGQKG